MSAPQNGGSSDVEPPVSDCGSGARQRLVDDAYDFHGTVRLLIGGLAAEPPTKTISADPAGTISGFIGTSVPGAGTVNLNPPFDRRYRLDQIEAQRTTLTRIHRHGPY